MSETGYNPQVKSDNSIQRMTECVRMQTTQLLFVWLDNMIIWPVQTRLAYHPQLLGLHRSANSE